MATTQDTNRRSDVIRCEYCGEDYSVTYKRCPFCEGKAGLGSMTSGRGGKRVATNKRGGGYGGGMEPVQVIGLVLSLILIAAAIYIVYTVLSPLFSRGTPSGSDVSVSVSQSEGASLSGSGSSLPSISGSGDVSASVDSSSSVTPPDVSTPVTPPPSGSGSGVITPIITATGITLAKTDVTLKADEPYKIVATLAPAGCTDTITWTSSNESAATVAQDGTVINVNKGNSQVSVTITARVGDVSAVCTVRCKPGSTGSSTGTTVTTGTTGTVTGTSTGLYVRTSPSTSAAPKESLLNGTQVTIVEDTGSGWYKINYSGNGGKIENGYVSKDYIKTN